MLIELAAEQEKHRMKFQCGTCGKYYLIEHAEQISTKQMLRCIDCGNIFMLQKDLAFSSSSGNSKLICEHCGSLAHEESGACQLCNPALNKLREEFQIDNRAYTFFVVRKGRIRPKHGRRGAGKAVLLTGAGVLALVMFITFLPGGKRDALKHAILKPLGIKSRIETDVVILSSGLSLYADKVEHEGRKVRITEKSGQVLTVDEQDIAYSAKAMIED
jgi:DNA-directed RNA polymerase subunit RPC12/RpoP